MDTIASSPSPAAEAFTRAAAAYDTLLASNAALVRLRRRAQRRMLAVWRPGQRILELNCGTGADAVFLATHGMRVFATDVAPGMLERARARVRAAGLERQVAVGRLAFADLSLLAGDRFDGILSMFGGLNCGDDLAALARDTARLLRSGGMFLACFLGKYALWEIATGMMHADPRRAFRRWRTTPVIANVEGIGVPTRYWSYRAVRAAFAPSFTIERCEGWSVVSPPPGSARFLTRHGRVSAALFDLEERLGDRVPFNRLGDHLFLELRRR